MNAPPMKPRTPMPGGKQPNAMPMGTPRPMSGAANAAPRGPVPGTDNPEDRGYPGGAEIMAQEGPQMPGMEGMDGAPGGANPIVDAFQSIAMFVAALKEQGAPQAMELESWLSKGIEILTQQGPGQEQNKMGFDPFKAPPEAGGGQPEKMNRSMGQGENSTELV